MADKKTVTCVICNKNKAPYQFIKHGNENMSDNFGYCKECIKNSVNEMPAIEVMRLLNKPYLESFWNDALKKDPENTIGKYLQLIAPKKAYRGFIDSEYSNDYDEERNVITDQAIARWGAGLEEDKYLELEASINDLRRIKEPSTALEEKRYVENVRIYQRLKREIDEGKATDIKALKATYAQDLKELGLDIEASKDDDLSLGERVRDWEKNEPIPKLSREFEDVDNISAYITKFFLIPMKRLFNQATDEELGNLYDNDNLNPEEFM